MVYIMNKNTKVIEALYKHLHKWENCVGQMVGNLYPEIARMRYIYPVNRKLIQLKYHNKYKNIDFYQIYKNVKSYGQV